MCVESSGHNKQRFSVFLWRTDHQPLWDTCTVHVLPGSIVYTDLRRGHQEMKLNLNRNINSLPCVIFK